MNTISIPGPDSLPAAARQVLQLAGPKRVLAFYGEMGAGKTTLIKAICKALGVEGVTSSPTFSLVNEYPAPDGKKIYHFDFYRLKNETEALDMGCEEYFYSGSWCFIEWPERIVELLPSDALPVKITVQGGSRLITVGQ